MITVEFSDLHGHNHQANSFRLTSGRNSRLQHAIDVLNQIAAYCETHHVDYVLFNGDLFHSRGSIEIDVYWEIYAAIERIRERVKMVFLMVGNHDQYSRIGDVHSLQPFRRFCVVIDKPEVHELDGRGIGFAPFTANTAALKAWFKTLPSLDRLSLHQGCNQAQIGAFNVYIKAEISVEDLPLDKVQEVWMGHYHKEQIVYAFNGREVRYIGSPLQITAAERNEPKHFLVKNWNTGVVTKIPTVAPRFRWYDSLALMRADTDLRVDDFVKVRVHPGELADLKNERPNAEPDVIREEDKRRIRLDPTRAYSDKELITEYITRNAPPGLDHSKLVEMATSFLEGE